MASTILVNTIDTQAGSTITIPTGKTLVVTDAAGLTVGGTTIESGNVSVNTITSASTDLGTGSEVAMWTGKNKAIFMVDASSGNKIVQLPAADATGRSTVSIVICVKATNSTDIGTPTIVTPYTVTVNDSSVSEVFTLYMKGDHVEFVSDGTNDLRTGNEHISAQGIVYRNVIESIPAHTFEDMFSATEYTIMQDIGGWFSTVHLGIDIPYDCRILCQTFSTLNNTDLQHMAPRLIRYYNSRASNQTIHSPGQLANNMHGMTMTSFNWDFDGGDDLNWSIYNMHPSAAYDATGTATAYNTGCWARWTVVRRF